MSTTKRIIGDYTIETLNGNVAIIGNLTVSGNTTTINSTNTSVADNIITLNKGESASGVSSGSAGIEIDRGLAANVQIRWNESIDRWQTTNDGTTFANIVTGSSGTSLSAVVDDPAPVLGGNLNVTGKTIFTDNTKGSVQVFANTAGSGGSGIYVTNTTVTGAELVTKAKAVAYSIVFG